MKGLYYLTGMIVGYIISFNFHVVYHWMNLENGWGLLYGATIVVTVVVSLSLTADSFNGRG